jgi:hypothetical protein
MDDEVGVADELDMRRITAFAGFQVTFARAPIVGFVIGGVNHARAVRFEAIADSECGVIEILRGDPDILDRKAALDDLVIMQLAANAFSATGK